MKRWLPALLIIALLAVFRILGSAFPETIPNLQPLPAFLICGFVFLKGAQRWAVPLATWLITDPITSIAQGYSILGWHNLSVVIGILATIGLAKWTRRHPTVLPVLASSFVAALVFHFLTNLVSFVVDPQYTKDGAGFLQSQWTGGPSAVMPTWVFLRNLVAANVLFSGLFLFARLSLPQTAPQTDGALAR